MVKGDIKRNVNKVGPSINHDIYYYTNHNPWTKGEIENIPSLILLTRLDKTFVFCNQSALVAVPVTSYLAWPSRFN